MTTEDENTATSEERRIPPTVSYEPVCDLCHYTFRSLIYKKGRKIGPIQLPDKLAPQDHQLVIEVIGTQQQVSNYADTFSRECDYYVKGLNHRESKNGDELYYYNAFATTQRFDNLGFGPIIIEHDNVLYGS